MRHAEMRAMLQDAIELARSGQHIEARRLLERIVEADPTQEVAWMWLATVSRDREERIHALERALALNPNNPTTQEAYARLMGRSWQPPETPVPTGQPRTGWLDVLTRDVSISTGNAIMIMAVGAVAIFIIVLVVSLRGEEKSATTPPTPRFLLPSATPTLRYTLTPSNTPRPTRTPGPSPTSIWDVPPPTWTEAPTRTSLPSRTPAPTRTPTPSATVTDTLPPPTATFTPLPPTATRTPGLATQTAAFMLTRDAPSQGESGAATVTVTPLSPEEETQPSNEPVAWRRGGG